MTFSKEWLEILDRVLKIKERNKFSTTWYRGMSSAEYKLNSGLLRETADRETVLKYERIFYYSFKNMGHMEHNKTDWDLLYVMQHHGVKTRLLDWSESFSVALFFAYSTWDQESDAVVWALDPAKLNLVNVGFEGLWILGENGEDYLDHIEGRENKETFAIYPLKNSKRMVAQQGVFTLQGSNMLPLEDELKGTEGILEKIIIPKELALDVEAYLELCGANYYTLFPDLDGLAKHLNNIYPDFSGEADSKIVVPDIPDYEKQLS